MRVVTGSHLDHSVDWEQAEQNPFIGLPAQSHDSSVRNPVWEAAARKKVLSSWWINQLNVLLLWNAAKGVMYEQGNWEMENGLRVSLARQQQLLECCILWWCPRFEADGDELMNSQRTMGSWVSDLRNPALVITEMLGGGEFSVNCLHGEQMFSNRLLSWADYDIMHLRLNKSRLEIQHNLAVRVNDHWNSFTKACGTWAVTSTFRSPGNSFQPWKALSFKQELISKSPLSSAGHGVSQPTHPGQLWPVTEVMSKCLLHHGYPGRWDRFFAAEFSGSCGSSLACGCCGFSLLPSSTTLLLPLLSEMLLPIFCPPTPIPF